MRYTTTDGLNKTLNAIYDGAQWAKMGIAEKVKSVEVAKEVKAAKNAYKVEPFAK